MANEGGHFQVLHVAPRALTMNQRGFVEAVYGLGEGIVLRVTGAADRWFDASFGQTRGIANGQILPAAVRVVNQAALLNRPAIIEWAAGQ